MSLDVIFIVFQSPASFSAFFFVCVDILVHCLQFSLKINIFPVSTFFRLVVYFLVRILVREIFVFDLNPKVEVFDLRNSFRVQFDAKVLKEKKKTTCRFAYH